MAASEGESLRRRSERPGQGRQRWQRAPQCRAFAECGRRAGLNLESSVNSLDVLKHSNMTRLEL